MYRRFSSSPPSAQAARIEQAFVLIKRVTIGHAGDIVGNRARAAGRGIHCLQLLCLAEEIGRQQTRTTDQRVEQFADHALGLDYRSEEHTTALQSIMRI